MQEHYAQATGMQSTLASLVFEGVFERFPKLKVVLIEGGFAWAPALVLAHGQGLGAHARRGAAPEAAAVGVRARARVVHHPADRGAGQAASTCVDIMEWVGWDRIMFSTDYPHWDFDDPAQVFAKLKLTAKQKAMLLRDNARALYGLRMSRRVLARPARSPPGTCKIVTAMGREIGIFNVGGEYYALSNRCPHMGAELCKRLDRRPGAVRRPGEYR